jgi:hypothetical protein
MATRAMRLAVPVETVEAICAADVTKLLAQLR